MLSISLCKNYSISFQTILYLSFQKATSQIYAITANSKKQNRPLAFVVSRYALRHVPQRAVKGKILADFLVDHPMDIEEKEIDVDLGYTSLVLWRLEFDGSKTDKKSGAGIVLITPN